MQIRYEVHLWVMHILKSVPGHIGCALRRALLPCRFGRGVNIWDGTHIDMPSRLRCGDNVSINRGCTINACGGITIGNDVLIGPRVTIYSQNHRHELKAIPFREQGYSVAEVQIGNNVWIAANVTILPGVVIGDNCVIAAGAVVARDVPPGVVVAGVPAKFIKEISVVN